MIKRIHTVAGLVVLAYLALVIFNIPPLVRSDHVAVNWNLLHISVLGFLIATAFVIGAVMLKRRMNLSGVHLAILMAEATIIAMISAIYMFCALRFFGVL